MKYWKSLEEKNTINTDIKEDIELSKEIKTSRRGFLKYFGFSLASASILNSCKKPIEKAIPFLIKPEDRTPGQSNYYATTYYDGNDYCSILVKVRDGRPIKIEGNDLSSISNRGTNSRVQASVLNLYDNARLKHPLEEKQKTEWGIVDDKIISNLNTGKTVILSSNIISPSSRNVIQDFQKKYKNTVAIQYDPISVSGMLIANKKCFGIQALPSYQFNKTDIVVSFGADFLGTWLSPVEFSKQYGAKRKLSSTNNKMLKHIQFETGMSLTGSNADERIAIKPSEEATILLNLRVALLQKNKTKNTTASSYKNVNSLANELLKNKGKVLVISNSNDVDIQILVNDINRLLDSYGNTIDLNNPLYTKQAIDNEMNSLIEEMNLGKIDNLILWNVNPAYDYPSSQLFIDGLKKVKCSIAISNAKNETTELVNYVCPDHHYLESWGDARPKKNHFNIIQPCIHPIFNTRKAEDSLLKWAGIETDYYEYVKNYWKENIYPKQTEIASFEIFWNQTLQNGAIDITNKKNEWVDTTEKIISTSTANLNTTSKNKLDTIEVQLYESYTIGNGIFANNPWLQELPDNISKVCWDNYIAIPNHFAKKHNLKNGDVVSINGIELPIFIQPGQTQNTFSIALGYGRKTAGKVGNNVGKNVYPLLQFKNGLKNNYFSTNNVILTGKEYLLATTQEHSSMEGRDIIRETTLKKYLKNKDSGNEMHAEIEKHHTTLYEEHKFEGHHWGLTIDLNSCIGCSNCITSCQAENNIPVIGKKETALKRSMHWIRLDRYYNGEEKNPEVVFQPVMCQHCDNAPCENVCPVSATMHSSEGINQQVYNRCIGTRYCMNNCSYKVRKFNWYQYTDKDSFKENPSTDDLSRLVLNPDVTVRERGVVEKCSFCIQRIQDKKLKAKGEGRKLNDGEIKTACTQSCPTDALIFGDLNDPKSGVSKLVQDPRNYHLLEELHTLPSVSYLTKVRNKDQEEETLKNESI